MRSIALSFLTSLALLSCTCVEKGPAAVLLDNMGELRSKGIMLGAQSPTSYGISEGARWADDGSISRSDTKELTGSHPAVCGWEIADLELDHPSNIDGESFDAIRKHIQAAYSRGAVNEVSWHCNNPVTMKNAWDNTPAAGAILPGGEKHQLFLEWMDRLAAFFDSLRTPEGKRIPVIFRPWHEHTGNGFWWGKGSITADQYKALYQFTVTYLRDTKGLDNLLFAYSPDAIHFIWSPREKYRDIYLEFWPGDEYVDIIGLDAYDADGRRFSEEVPYLCGMIADIAAEKGKIAALTECGIENNNPAHSSYYNKEWWTGTLYPAIRDKGLSFVVVWRNGGIPPESHYFNAYRGCYSESDYLSFTAREDILLENDLPELYK